MMKNRNRVLSLFVVMILLLTSSAGYTGKAEEAQNPSEAQISNDAPSETPVSNRRETWSVFLYLCGTDLESDDGMATQSIKELLKVNQPDHHVNFIIQTGGTHKWKRKGIRSKALQRWELADNDLSLVDEQPLASMGDQQTLADFLSWGVHEYPADKYMVVFWDHGGGSAAGVEFDELYDGDSLSLEELRQGLSAAGVTFEVVGFDTCLMASIENAAAVAPYGKYMVASEESEPGGGWDYTSWVQYLIDHPSESGLEIGTVICDSYYAKCEAESEDAMATLSVVDLSAIPALADRFEALATEMTGVATDISKLQKFMKGTLRAESYGGNNEDEGYTNMVDLGDLVMNTENVLSETAVSLLDALFTAVKYNVKGSKRAEANGLSVYFPLAIDDEELTTYAETAATSRSYVRFIEAISGWKAPEGVADDVPVVQNAVKEDDYSVQLESSITDEGVFTLNITSGMESVASVLFSIQYMDYEHNEYMLLGVDSDINADWNTGTFTDNFRGVWPTINGYYCAPTLLSETDAYNLYTIPIMLNGSETNLRAAYVWDTEEEGHFEIYGAWNGIDGDTGMSAKDIIKLKDGDEIKPLFNAVNWKTGEKLTYEMGGFTVDGTIDMQESPLYDGDYLYQYIVTDVFGRKSYSDQVIMGCKEGEISVGETEAVE